jgi:hypothetical protein
MTRSTYYAEPTDFAWMITVDHLYKSAPDTFSDETGVTGPSEAPDDLIDALEMDNQPKNAMTYTFRMYDDDGELYYTGRLITFSPDPSEEALYAPLADFGGPNAGATLIKYTNHPEWTMEY